MTWPYLIAFSGLAFGWLLPLHFQPWTSWHAEAAVFVGVFGAACFGLFQGLKSRSTVAVPWLALPVLAFAGVALAQYGVGLLPYSGELLLVWFYAAFCVVCLVLGYATNSPHHLSVQPSSNQLTGPPIKPRADPPTDPLIDPSTTPPVLLSAALVVIGIASAGAGLVQAFDVWTHTDWFVRSNSLVRHGGQVSQANHFALGLLLALVSTIYLFCSSQCNKYTAFLAITLFGMGLSVSQSRAGLLSVIAIAVWWVWKQPFVAPAARRWWALAVGGWLVALFFAWPPVFDTVFFVGDAASSAAFRGVGSPRFVVWPQLWQAVLAHPWFGWGVLQVSPALNSVAHNYPVSDAFTYSHTVVLDLLVWLGIPLALLFMLGALAWLARTAWRVSSLTAWFLFGLLVPLVVGSLLEFPYAYAHCMAPVLFALGMLERGLSRAPMVVLRSSVVAVPLAVVSLVLAWSAVEYVRLEEDVRVARFEALRVGKTAEGYVPPSTLLLNQLSSLANAVRVVPAPNMTKEQLDLLKSAALRYPWTATGYRYALALALNGGQAEALRQMQIMRVMHGEKTYLQLMGVLQEKLNDHNVVWQPEKR